MSQAVRGGVTALPLSTGSAIKQVDRAVAQMWIGETRAGVCWGDVDTGNLPLAEDNSTRPQELKGACVVGEPLRRSRPIRREKKHLYDSYSQ